MTQQGIDEKGLGLFIKEQQKDLSVRKSIKVKLPIRQHIKLHALKLFTDNNISETVERALDAYFAEMNGEAEDATAAAALAASAPVGELEALTASAGSAEGETS